MKVVLLENIRKLGKIGDIVSVKAGFGRNWLLPQKKALRATESNLRVFETKKSDFEAQNAEKKVSAQKLSENVKEVVLEMVSPAQVNGVLYGSITIKDIYDALKAKNIEVTKNQINLHKPIKEVGKHMINIMLHPEVSCDIVLYVGGTKEALHELINPEKKLEDYESEADMAQMVEEPQAVEASKAEEELSA